MGLCKCPKRRVTNQFCFEHRVNVCEYCMVTNHPKCIVQSYLQWLKDSDYNPICELCSKDLENQECVRLTCYHVYHWSCLDRTARSLPPTTAAAGYLCPACRMGIFPASNLVSPVADVLREKLSAVNWARAGLGLPLLGDELERRPTAPSPPPPAAPVPPIAPPQTNHQQLNSTPQSFNSELKPKTASTIVHVEDGFGHPYPTSSGQVPRRAAYPTSPLISDGPLGPNRSSSDHDENKYKRRSAIEFFLRWSKTIAGPMPRRNTPGGGRLIKRYVLIGLLIILGLATLVVVFSWLGRMSTDQDPALDPMHNPNVRVMQQPVAPAAFAPAEP